jgi:hypothetical protein
MLFPGGRAPDVRIVLDEPAWAPTSNLGWLLTARHEQDTSKRKTVASGQSISSARNDRTSPGDERFTASSGASHALVGR